MLILNQKGDTIVEVLIALAVIGSVIITSSLAVDGIARTNGNNYTRQQAIQVLQNQMELVKAMNSNLDPNIYSLKVIFNNLGTSTTSPLPTSNTFCVSYVSSAVLIDNLSPTDPSHKCKFEYPTGLIDGNTGFWSISLNLVQADPSNNPTHFNLQGEIDWYDQGKTSQSNAKLTYELVSSKE